MPHLNTVLAMVLVSLAFGCSSVNDDYSAAKSADFRIRSSFDEPLNSDTGWAGAVNESVDIIADQPFRIRFAVEPLAEQHYAKFYQLQYQRNGGPWETAEAHDFPHPLREAELDPTSLPDWTFLKGNKSNFTSSEQAGEKILQMANDVESMLGVYRSAWDVTELEVEFYLPTDVSSGIGFVYALEDNRTYNKVFINPDTNSIILSRMESGTETVIAEHMTIIPSGQWLTLEIDFESNITEINFADETLEFEADMGSQALSPTFGFYAPSNSHVSFKQFTFAGEAETPIVSIVSCPGFENGEPTKPLLTTADEDFEPGSGVALATQSSRMNTNSISEYEWAVVVRRFADQAVTNEAGDSFAFRMIPAGSEAHVESKHPSLTLSIPPGHLGGTFIETPGRIGPWQPANGDLYFIMEPTETDNLFMMVKSTDNGRTWREVDAIHRPETGDLEAVEGRQIGDTIYMIHQITETVHHHAFRTSDHSTHPDSWVLTDELAGTTESAAQGAAFEVRSDGSMAAFYIGETLQYSIRSKYGRWSDSIVTETNTASARGPKTVLGFNDTVHLAYYRTDGTIHYRKLLSDGTLTMEQLLATGAGRTDAEMGAVLPLIYIPESDTVVILYRLEDGYLWERRIYSDGTITQPVKVSDRVVVTNAVDSQQAGADAVLDGDTIHILFIDEETRSIYHTHNRGGWQESTIVIENILGSWVRGSVYERPDSSKKYGFVYDAGSEGGSGMNRFLEIDLD